MFNKAHTSPSIRQNALLLAGGLLVAIALLGSCGKKETTSSDEGEGSHGQNPFVEVRRDADSVKRRLNSQLEVDMTEGNPKILDLKTNALVFEFPITSGDVDMKQIDSNTLSITVKAHLPDTNHIFSEYQPVCLTLQYFPDHYTLVRDTKRETLPYYGKGQFEALRSKWKTYKSNPSVFNVPENPEPDPSQIQKISNEIELFDSQLAAAALNGCDDCLDIFSNKWPALLGEKLDASYLETHNANEDLITLYFKK